MLVSHFFSLIVLTFSGFARLIHHSSTTMSLWVFSKAGAGVYWGPLFNAPQWYLRVVIPIRGVSLNWMSLHGTNQSCGTCMEVPSWDQ